MSIVRSWPIGVLGLALASVGVHAEETIKIGVIQPLTGSVAYNGTTDVNGSKLALDEINAKGGVLGKKVELVIEDGQCRPANSVSAAEKLIQRDKVVALEGKVFRDLFPLDNPDRPYSALEFQRNYENAIRDLGGAKVNTVQFTDEVNDAFGGRDAVDAHFHGTCAGVDCENNTYLVRQGGKEYWILVSTGAIPLHGAVVVLERKAMESRLGFLDASAMKQAIDATGKVALHINFDVDKATLRPDAQPVVAEIDKLLSANPALKLSIEGHTDDTGSAAHNRELSAARARSVLGALVGMGIDPARLSSTGYGQDRPVADNGSEAGRAQNRRVELVKVD